jgi:hypothetical protein
MSRRKAQSVGIKMSEAVVDYLPRHPFMTQFQQNIEKSSLFRCAFEEAQVISW